MRWTTVLPEARKPDTAHPALSGLSQETWTPSLRHAHCGEGIADAPLGNRYCGHPVLSASKQVLSRTNGDLSSSDEFQPRPCIVPSTTAFVQMAKAPREPWIVTTAGAGICLKRHPFDRPSSYHQQPPPCKPQSLAYRPVSANNTLAPPQTRYYRPLPDLARFAAGSTGSPVDRTALSDDRQGPRRQLHLIRLPSTRPATVGHERVCPHRTRS